MCFNPLPAIKLGDADLGVYNACVETSFNPLPAIKLGDASINLSDERIYVVSIHSQRLNWEMLVLSFERRSSSRFNPLPAIKLGDANQISWFEKIPCEFQSTPSD